MDGDDYLEGTSGTDVIHGLSGEDVIESYEGDDIICGGRGDDSPNLADDLRSVRRPGHDRIHGGRGSDLIGGGNSPSALFEDGSGSDVMMGGMGHDTICDEGCIRGGGTGLGRRPAHRRSLGGRDGGDGWSGHLPAGRGSSRGALRRRPTRHFWRGAPSRTPADNDLELSSGYGDGGLGRGAEGDVAHEGGARRRVR